MSWPAGPAPAGLPLAPLWAACGGVGRMRRVLRAVARRRRTAACWRLPRPSRGLASATRTPLPTPHPTSHPPNPHPTPPTATTSTVVTRPPALAPPPDYEYVKIISQLRDARVAFRLLGLSATPGRDFSAVQVGAGRRESGVAQRKCGRHAVWDLCGGVLALTPLCARDCPPACLHRATRRSSAPPQSARGCVVARAPRAARAWTDYSIRRC